MLVPQFGNRIPASGGGGDSWALYHLDDSITAAVGSDLVHIAGSAETYEPGKFSNGLSFRNTETVKVPHAADFPIQGTGDWTVDLWFDTTGTSQTTGQILSTRNGGDFSGFGLAFNGADGSQILMSMNGLTSWAINGNFGTLSTGLHHVAMERFGGHINIYLDGTRAFNSTAIGASDTINYGGNGMGIGAIISNIAPASSSTMFDELRILDYAAYGGVDFTPETSPYTG